MYLNFKIQLEIIASNMTKYLKQILFKPDEPGVPLGPLGPASPLLPPSPFEPRSPGTP